MYLHLGKNVVVPNDSIVGIFDLDNTTGSQITKNFLRISEKNGAVEEVGDDLPKAFVLCSYRGEEHIYLSQLSPQTLLKRSTAENFEF